jgi:hypothetical protein
VILDQGFRFLRTPGGHLAATQRWEHHSFFHHFLPKQQLSHSSTFDRYGMFDPSIDGSIVVRIVLR